MNWANLAFRTLARVAVVVSYTRHGNEVDRSTADRAALIAVTVRLQATVLELQRRIAELEGPAQPGGPARIPGLKPKANRKPSQPKPPCKPRRYGFARAA